MTTERTNAQPQDAATRDSELLQQFLAIGSDLRTIMIVAKQARLEGHRMNTEDLRFLEDCAFEAGCRLEQVTSGVRARLGDYREVAQAAVAALDADDTVLTETMLMMKQGLELMIGHMDARSGRTPPTRPTPEPGPSLPSNVLVFPGAGQPGGAA